MNSEQVFAMWYLISRKRKSKRRYWVHPMVAFRREKGMFNLFYQELRLVDEKFFNYTRMSVKSFDELLDILNESIRRQDTPMRRSISPEEKLLVTLRYLATGCSFVDLHYSYRLGETTIREFVQETCLAIWNSLKDMCLPEPSQEQWLKIAEDFNTTANFPHCIGAVDGKHIRVIKPEHSGSLNFNYKHFFSIVLLAICDADYKFIAINVGADGKEADSTVFKNSKFYKSLENGDLDIPKKIPLNTSANNTPMPYVLVGDEGFGLTEYVMRPYAGHSLSVAKRVFNYRLTRARRFIECTFGILANKWRIFHRPLNVKRSFAINIVKACCILHNFVRTKDGNADSRKNTERNWP